MTDPDRMDCSLGLFLALVGGGFVIIVEAWRRWPSI